MKNFFNEEDKMLTASFGFGFICVLIVMLSELQDRGDQNVFMFLGVALFVSVCVFLSGMVVYYLFYKLCEELLKQKWILIATILLIVFFVGFAATNNYGDTPIWNIYSF